MYLNDFETGELNFSIGKSLKRLAKGAGKLLKAPLSIFAQGGGGEGEGAEEMADGESAAQAAPMQPQEGNWKYIVVGGAVALTVLVAVMMKKKSQGPPGYY
jgi:hypothetical protein